MSEDVQKRPDTVLKCPKMADKKINWNLEKVAEKTKE